MNLHLPSLFHIFYTSCFTVLTLCLVILLFITPGDAIRQALQNDQVYNVAVIGAVYVFTFISVCVIYFSRLWTNKAVLATIPKTWIPVEKGEVSKNVRKMIVASLARSAAIAWDSRPRVVAPEPPTIISAPNVRDTVAKVEPEHEERKRHGFLHRHHKTLEEDKPTIAIPPTPPIWGNIGHAGWASPLSPDLPNLQYATVILELPHLIEAKAVSLAPPDPDSKTEPPLPDLRAVDLLQRPAATGLRDYIGHLIEIGVFTSPHVATEFLSIYEYSRFGGRPLNEERFRDLMKHFAELLRTMTALDPAILVPDEESDIDDDASSSSTPRSRSLASSHSVSSRSGSEGTICTAPSRRPTLSSGRKRSDFSTALATPRSKKRAVSRTPSTNSFAQSRRMYDGSSASDESLRSTSQGSVIKLSRTHEDGFVLDIPRLR